MAVAYDPLSDETPISGMTHPDTYDPLSDQPNRTLAPAATGDMTPGPPLFGPLNTSYKSLPSRENGSGQEWGVPADAAPQRIRQAGYDAFRGAPSLGTEPGNMSVLSTKAQDWLNEKLGPTLGTVANLPGKVIGTGIGALAGGGAMVGQTLNELASGVVPPALQRDANLGVRVAAPFVPALRTAHVAPSLRLPTAEPRLAGGIGEAELQTALQREALRKSGLLGEAADGPASPTGVGPRMPPPEGYTPGVRVYSPSLDSAAAVKKIASDSYTRADQISGEILSPAIDRSLDRLLKIPEQQEGGKIIAGEDPVNKMIHELQALRGKPLTLQGFQEMDEALGRRITDQWSVTGLSSVGERLMRVQRELRDTVANLGPDDLAKGSAGFDALKTGRGAWAQYTKMRDLERMQAKANMMENPTQSFKVMVRNMLFDEDKIRGWSPEERKALRDAGNRGSLGNALHAFGGRLGKYAAAGIGATTPLGPILGGATGLAVGEAGGAGVRSLINNAMNERIRKALLTLGKGVPAPEDAGGTVVVPRRQ